MGKASKAKATQPILSVAPVATAEVPKKTTKSKAKATETVAKSKVVEPVSATPAGNTVVSTEATVSESTDIVLTEVFGEFMSKFQSLLSQMNALKTEFRALEKKAVRELKTAQKLSSKRKRKTGNRSPSGFVKPTLISTELANFLKKPVGTEMARTEVTREINGYIRANNLQDKTNGRKINPDTSLATLLKINDGDELTYFNLQRYMSPHFAKAGSSLPKIEQESA